MYYLGILVLVFLFNEIRNTLFFRNAMTLLFAVFYGFRYNVGRDYLAYYDIFVNHEASGWLEPGYYWLQWAFSGLPYFYFKFTLGLILHFCIFDVLYRLKNLNFFTVSLWLLMPFGFIFAANGVRQAIAVALGFYALTLSKNTFKNVCILSLAISFHYSAVFLIPLFVVLHKEKGRFLSVILFILIGLSVLYGIKILSVTKYGVYLTLDMFTKSNAKTSLGFYALILISFFSVVFSRGPKVSSSGIVGSIILRMLFVKSSILFRLVVYLEPFLLLVMHSVSRLDKRTRFIFKSVTLVIMVLLFLKSYSSKDYFIPYDFAYYR